MPPLFGWLFVSSATFVVSVTTFILPPTALTDPNAPIEILIFWMFLWGAVAAASTGRSSKAVRSSRSIQARSATASPAMTDTIG